MTKSLINNLIQFNRLIIFNKNENMGILLKRNYKLIIIFIIIILVSFTFSSTRIISYNFWTYFTQIVNKIYSHTNSINILNDEEFHEITIDISNSQYKYILNSYKNNSEKEYVKIDITIDGKKIENVWIRLKWDIDLVELLSYENNSTFISPSFLIKFDQYITWQTYWWLTQISLRSDSTDSLLWQLISFKIFRDIWLLAPKAWLVNLNFWNYWSYLYMVNEVIDEDFIKDNFINTSWVLYKALNSLSFAYIWDDPTLYVDLFEQESQENKYDLKLLINILKFVSTSTDEEFEEKLENYIDINSYVWILVMEELLWKQNMLLWLLNNYYIYVDNETNKAYFITWDQKMSFWNTNTPIYEILQKYYSKNDLNNPDKITSILRFTSSGVKTENISDDWWDKTYLNDLKKRFLENDYYKNLYEKKLIEYKNIIYIQWLAKNTLNYYKEIFLKYEKYTNFTDLNSLNEIIKTIENYIISLT